MLGIDRLRTGLVASLLLAVAVAGVLPALPARAQVNPFGKAGGNLTAEDWTAINEARSSVLAEPATVGATRSWTNPKSGNSGTISITGTVQRQGMECRAVKYIFNLKAQQRTAVAPMNECKTDDGTWKYLM